MINSRGFTIVEVLVVIGIILVFSIIVISNFPEARFQFALSRAAYKFEQDIRKVQADAFSATPYYDANGAVIPVFGYGIYVGLDDSGTKRYIIYANASLENETYDGQDYVINTIDLALDEPGVRIKEILNAPGNAVSVNFSPPNPTIKISGSMGQETDRVDIVFVQENDTSKRKTVSIYSTGLIEVK